MTMSQTVYPEDRDKHRFLAAGKEPKGNERVGQVTIAASHKPPQNEVVNFKYFDFNLHATKKTVSSALLDVALLMANAGQLKNVMTLGKRHPYYYLMMTLLSLSLMLQILIGLFLIFLGKTNINIADDRRHRRADQLNTVTMVGVFLLAIMNIFISSFGVIDDRLLVSATTVAPQ